MHNTAMKGGILALLALSAVAAALPNIVYIMTDDQDIELGGLTPMPKTRALLGAQGATGEALLVLARLPQKNPSTPLKRAHKHAPSQP